MKQQGAWEAQAGRPVTVCAVVLALAAVWAAGRSGDGRWLLLAISPLLEELVFRWGVQDGLEALGAPAGTAMAGSAAAFALLHGVSRSMLLGLAVLLPALAFAAIYRRTRRLGPCIAAHVAANAVWLALAGRIEGARA